ncbi:MAG: Uma2 family endonuclease [Aridibacter sp.]
MSQSNLAYKKEHFTDKDYLEFERNADTKHEFRNGKIVAMAGASDMHNVISSNIYGEIYIKLKGSECRPFSSDMRVKAETGSYFYPDIVITCGEREFEDEENDVLINPKVIVEVLSKSTKLKDRNEKFDSYLKLESLTDYVLVEQNEMRIEHYFRTDENEWKFRLLENAEDELVFNSINCKVFLNEIYTEVELAPK